MLSVAVVGANSLALSPILGNVAADLATTPVAVARANAAYGGATALSALCLGGLADRHGAHRILVWGLVGLAAAMLASAGATHWAWLAAAQAGAGLAAGVVLPATYGLATSVSPPGREAAVLGRVLTGWSVSMVIGVPVAAWVATFASWRASYGGLALLLAIAALGIARRAPAPRPKASPTGGFLQTLRSPGVAPLLMVCCLFMTAFYGVYSYLGDQVRRQLGLDAGQAGLVVLAYGVGFGLAMLGDRLVDRLGPGRLFPLVLLLLALVYAALAPASLGWVPILALTTLWGFLNHFGLNIMVLRLAAAAGERRASALALNSAVTYAGALVGAGMFGMLYERFGFGALSATAAACLAVAVPLAVTGRRRMGGEDHAPLSASVTVP